MKEVFTTHEVSKICKVDITSVINWVKSGRVQAYKTPGGHRRIKRKDLVVFLKQYGFPATEDLMEPSTSYLVVDDDEAMRDLLKSTIVGKWPDSKVYEAEDGFAAGKLLSDKKPDVVILDIKLPGVDGLGVCKLIKDDEKLSGTKILAITGYSTPDAKAKMIQAGAHGFLEKPFNREKLIKNIERLLD